MEKKEPILLLLYKRPYFAEKQLELLYLYCRDHKIYVSIDGPKKESKKAVLEVYNVVEKYKKKFKHKLVIRKAKKKLWVPTGSTKSYRLVF